MKKRLVSGITATGKLTIGNYIGAIKNFVKLQDDYNMFIFVADLHALTVDIEPNKLRKNREEILAWYLAAGINSNKSIIFYQSDVHAHGYMSWLLENQTTIGELSRMTQFKDKSQTSKEANGTKRIKTGLLTYPVLMAGDILLYNPSIVPVGNDQKQHLELTRNIAERINNKYGKTFTIPEPYISETGSRIMSLDEPTKKMSKSSKKEKSYIALSDNPDVAYNKIKKAVTDSEGKVYISNKKPGVTNLITIYASLKDVPLEQAEKDLKDLDYAKFKHEVGIVVKNFLIDIQKKFNHFLPSVKDVARLGAKKASLVANETLKTTKNKLGL